MINTLLPFFVYNKSPYFISVTERNSLKVYDVLKSADSNLICEIEESLNIKPSSIDIYAVKETFLACIGYENGRIKLWDLQTVTLLREISAHQGMVSGVSFLSDGTSFLSVGQDKKLCSWNVDNGEQLTSVSLSQQYSNLTCISNNRAVCSTNAMQIFDLASQKKIKQFQGHAKPITIVRETSCRQYILTCAGDRFINIWKGTSKKKKNVRAHTILQCDGVPVSLDVFTTNREEYLIVAITKTNKCLLWRLSLKTEKKKKAEDRTSVAPHFIIQPEVTPKVTNKFVGVYIKHMEKLYIAKGNSHQHVFEIVELERNNGQYVVKAKIQATASKKRKRESKRAVVLGAEDEIAVVEPEKRTAKRRKLSPVPKKVATENKDDRPMAGSLVSLVVAGIASRDESILQEVLLPKKVEVIQKTVCGLTGADAEKLFKYITEKFQEKYLSVPTLLVWIETLLKHHGHSIPIGLLTLLETLVAKRMTHLQPVIQLQGKVNYLLNDQGVESTNAAFTFTSKK